MRLLRWLFGESPEMAARRERALLFLARMEEWDARRPKGLRELQDLEWARAPRDPEYRDTLLRVHRAESEHVAYAEMEHHRQ